MLNFSLAGNKCTSTNELSITETLNPTSHPCHWKNLKNHSDALGGSRIKPPDTCAPGHRRDSVVCLFRVNCLSQLSGCKQGSNPRPPPCNSCVAPLYYLYAPGMKNCLLLRTICRSVFLPIFLSDTFPLLCIFILI